jgi:hypothetical protein
MRLGANIALVKPFAARAAVQAVIPWLDKNGGHNQPVGPNLEPSHI